MTDHEKLIWAAGFLDGEGYVGVTRCRSKFDTFRYRPEISAAQVKRAPLDVLADLFGGNVLTTKDAFGRHFYWRLYNQNAVRVIRQLQPYLVVKHAHAELVIDFQSTCPIRGIDLRTLPASVTAKRDAIYAALRELNRRRTRIHAERLNEKAPTGKAEGDAIVRTASNEKDAEAAEMPARLRAVK